MGRLPAMSCRVTVLMSATILSDVSNRIAQPTREGIPQSRHRPLQLAKHRQCEAVTIQYMISQSIVRHDRLSATAYPVNLLGSISIHPKPPIDPSDLATGPIPLLPATPDGLLDEWPYPLKQLPNKLFISEPDDVVG
jgi:hypothetical protein